MAANPPATLPEPVPPRARAARGAVRTAVVWQVLREALDVLVEGESRPLDVVDAGGGTGGLAVPIAELGHRVTVVDSSPDALAALERRVAEAGVAERVRAVQGDADELLDVLPPASADLVVCHGVLEHVTDPAAALRSVAAISRPTATLSLLAPNRNAAVLARAIGGHLADARRALSSGEGRWGEHDPAGRRFTADDLTRLVTAAGYTVSSVHGVRVFSDLVPGALLDDPADLAALLDLEAAASAHAAFAAIAAQIHVLATRH